MKTIRKTFLMLLASTALIFSACDESSEPDEIEEIPGEAGLYGVQTMIPDLTAEQVLFKGNLDTSDDQIQYGFQWYVQPQNTGEEPEVTRVMVGSGAIHGEFTTALNDLPKNVTLIVCAFVEFTFNGEMASEIGEEIPFDWDL